ncbi:Tetratricopeptide-like helical [Penicillium expansum]|nr:Tetratricopeptide-like helical [Penicillium expansum]
MALLTGVFSLSLSGLYLDCIQLFGEFLLALSEKDCRVICLEQVYLPKILEEYGRTKVWGDQTKANLPARARGSLDDTLRHDTELKHLVQAILMRLRALLSQGKSNSVSADSDSDSNDDGGNQHYRMPKIRLLVQQTLEQIRSLYDLSALLRRPKIVDKYIRSVNSESHIASLNNPYHLPLSIAFSRSDETHIIEKALQWRSLTKSAQGIDFEFKANTRRREQFQYWTDYPYDSRQDTIHTARLATPRLEEKKEPQNRGLTFQPSIPKVPRKGPKSTASKQSFSAAAFSDIHDTKTNVRPRTIYTPTAVGQGRSNSVPDPPKTAFGTTFLCPYCGTTLESSEMQNRQLWKRHVFRDLRPYVCIFEDCQNGGKLYVSHHDWIYHELQIYRRNYVCKVCQEMCSSRKEMSAHIREHYDDSMSPSQLGVILDLCNRQVDIADYEKYPCLICGEELSLSALQGHLAAHMEDIALFVLPNTNEKEDIGNSKASVQVAKLKSKGQISGTESELSSLGYSAAGDDRQIPTDFSKLLTSEEVGYAPKIWSWGRRDDDQISAPVKEMMETNNTNLGEDHPDTLASMTHLSLMYWNQGRWEEAEPLQVQVLETYKTTLGEDHPDTLASMTNLAWTYWNQGRWEEAEQLDVQVMETYKTTLGEDHPDTLASMTNLALTYRNQDRWKRPSS